MGPPEARPCGSRDPSSGTVGAVRIPLASYFKGQYGAPRAGGFFSGLPRFLKYSLIAFGVVSVLLGFVYLGSSFVASRYEFREASGAARKGRGGPESDEHRSADGGVGRGVPGVPAPGPVGV